MPDPEWIDDASVPDQSVLWRGVSPELQEIDGLTNRLIPREGAFRTQKVSMNIKAETTVAAMQAKGSMWRLWALRAKQIRDAGCIIVRDPEPDDPSHVLGLRADAPGNRLSGGMATRLRRNGYWEDEGPPPDS